MASPDTLLLADDSVTMQRVVELTLAEQGLKVVSVSDGQQAIDYITTHRPALALISVTLQKVSGFDVARHVRDHAQAHGLPVLLLAGAFDTIDDAQVRESGAVGVLVKPFEPAVVIKRVKELLGMSKAGTERPTPQHSSASGRLVTSTEEPLAAAVTTPESVTTGSKSFESTARSLTPATTQPLTDDRTPSAPSSRSGFTTPAASEAADNSGDYLQQLDAAFESLDAQLAGRHAPAARPTHAAPSERMPEEPVPTGPPSASSMFASATSSGVNEPGIPPPPVVSPPPATPEHKPVFEVDDNWFRQASATPQKDGFGDFVVTRASDYVAPSTGNDDRSWAPRGEEVTTDPAAARDELTRSLDQLAAAIAPPAETGDQSPASDGVRPAPAHEPVGTSVADTAPSAFNAPAPGAPFSPGATLATPPGAAADAFAMLWAHEQGEPLPASSPAPLELSDTSVHAVATELSRGLADRLVSSLADRLTGNIADRVGTPLAERLGETLTERLTAGLADRLIGGVADRLTAQLPAPIAAGVSDRVAIGVGERVSANLGDRVTATVSDHLTTGVADRVSAGLASPLATVVSERVTAGVAERVSVGLAEQIATDISERVATGVSERIAPVVADRIAPVIADRMLTALGERVSSGLAERVAELVAERMMQNTFGEALRHTVNEVAERLVRAEIERIRAAADSLRS